MTEEEDESEIADEKYIATFEDTKESDIALSPSTYKYETRTPKVLALNIQEEEDELDDEVYRSNRIQSTKEGKLLSTIKEADSSI